MTTFDEREQAFEKKYAHDAEMQFKAEARRDKLLGLWAADLMGMGAEEAEDYAKTVVIADLEEAGDEDVYRKVSADLEAKGVATDGLRAKMAELLAEAKAQVMGEIG
ncbi:MAG: DUF1476 domain-containing protein [Pseudomonadota bacterium]